MKKYLFCNWKSYLTIKESHLLSEKLSGVFSSDSKIVFSIFPTDAALHIVSRVGLPVGVQSVFPEESGAYTGATTLNIASEVNAKYVLVGHSERRTLFHETDYDVARQVNALLKIGITPVVCVGESLSIYDSGGTNEFLLKQLSVILDGVDISKIIIAYEPIWAINTSSGDHKNPADFEHAESVAKRIIDSFQGLNVTVLYGGSVDDKIDLRYCNSSKISGFLVGHSSTDFETVCYLYDKLSGL